MRNGLASIAKKRYLSCAVGGIFLCLLATAFASEPTLQETIDFISKKAGGKCTYLKAPVKETDLETEIYQKTTSDYRVTLLNYNTILVKEKIKTWHLSTQRASKADRFGGYRPYERAYENTSTSTWVAKARLDDLGTDVKIRIPKGMPTPGDGRQIVVECTKNNCIEWKETNRKKKVRVFFETEESRLPDRQKSSSSYILFTVCDQERAEKIKKALTHAIRISGGKDELF